MRVRRPRSYGLRGWSRRVATAAAETVRVTACLLFLSAGDEFSFEILGAPCGTTESSCSPPSPPRRVTRSRPASNTRKTTLSRGGSSRASRSRTRICGDGSARSLTRESTGPRGSRSASSTNACSRSPSTLVCPQGSSVLPTRTPPRRRKVRSREAPRSSCDAPPASGPRVLAGPRNSCRAEGPTPCVCFRDSSPCRTATPRTSSNAFAESPRVTGHSD